MHLPLVVPNVSGCSLKLCSEELNLPERAREYYQRGLRACPGSIPMWRLAARLEERTVGVNKARPMLEVAR